MHQIGNLLKMNKITLQDEQSSKSEISDISPEIVPIERDEAQIKADIAEHGIPRKYAGCFKSSVAPAIWDRLRPFFKGASYFICGPVGVGKTHVIATMAAHVIRNNPKWYLLNGNARQSRVEWPFFVTAPDMLMEIRATFSKHVDQSESDIINHYANMRCLIIDDLGTEKTSEWTLQVLYQILNGRYVGMRQTVITSNFSINELKNRVGVRIASRLAEMCEEVELSGKDRRLQA